MKKVLLIIDALNFKPDVLNFAAYIAKSEKARLTGVFLENFTHELVPAMKSLGGKIFVEEIIAEETESQKKTIAQNIEIYKEGCVQREVIADVHLDKGKALQNIIRESRYADLIITDPAISFSQQPAKVPSKFVIDLLEETECPVILAPEYFEQIDEIVFAYDGHKSSTFAIKQFCYLLPALTYKKLTVLHINNNDKNFQEYQNKISEWMEGNFLNTTFISLPGDAREELFKYFIEGSNNNRILVMGAYGRSLLSTLFKPATATLVVKAVDIPIFIAHK